MMLSPRPSLTSLFLLLLNASRCVIAAPTSSSTAMGATPVPLVIPPSQAWDGNDGPWSSFFLSVGTPVQTLRVLISTASNQPLVVLPEGCFSTDPADCASQRGGLFNPNLSSTWVQNKDSAQGIFSLVIETNLGISANALYGNDTIALGLPGGAPSLPGQNFGGLASKEFFMGSFGLNPAATNFSTFNDPVPSYMSNLKSQNQMPSISYGYTAGNTYRFNGVLASLTFGGYDASLIEPNDLTIDFDVDEDFDLTINVNTIAMSSGSGNKTLSASSFLAFIDSTTPYLWLPEEVCAAFEDAFGIVYDETSGLYLVNDTLHSQLLTQDANVTFALTNTTGNKFVDIVLPYQAFDLIAEWPLVQNTSRYFPLKRAVNDTQTTLGRAFLQEAYLIADYERSNFSIYQRKWDSIATQDIRAILPPGEAPAITPQNHKSVPVAAEIIGSIGGAVLVTLIIGLYILIRQRGQRLAVLQATTWKLKAPTVKPSDSLSQPCSPISGWKPELDAIHTEQQSPELEASSPSPRPRFGSIVEALMINTNVGDSSILHVNRVQGLHEMEANEPVGAEVAGSPVEAVLQEAVDELLDHELRAEEMRRQLAERESQDGSQRESYMLDVVSPLSPVGDIEFPEEQEQELDVR